MDITVAVSGGLDSLYSLLKLREEGYHVRALHARLIPPPPGLDPVPGLNALCARLEIPFQVVDLQEPFARQVVAPFVAAYRRARTPNPCALCNRAIKFGKLFDSAEKAQGFLATGHYAAVDTHPLYGRALHTARDLHKDQSYFLALVPPERLARCMFPLAQDHKEDVRRQVEQMGYAPPLREESQEICFVPDNDYRAFLESRGSRLSGAGPVVYREHAEAEGRVIAQHKGLWRYTEGQRKGLGIAWSHPLYVLGKQPERNALIVGPQSALEVSSAVARLENLMVDPVLWPTKIRVRSRYRQQAVPAQVAVKDGFLRIDFIQAQVRPAPGQLAVVYDEEGYVLAGGIFVRE